MKNVPMAFEVPKTTIFLKKFIDVMANVNVKCFEWSKDGKSLTIHRKQFEKDRILHRDLFSIFGGAKDLTTLTEFLCTQGFKNIKYKCSKKCVVVKHREFYFNLHCGYISFSKVNKLYQYVHLTPEDPAAVTKEPHSPKRTGLNLPLPLTL